MKKLMDQTPRSKTYLVKDNHLPDVYHVHQKTYVDDIVERNKRLRLEGYLKEGAHVPLLNDDLRYQFSFPPEIWARIKADHPEIWQQFNSGDHKECLKASGRLAILYPQYCTLAGNW